jgi:hypothetical protein
MTQIGLHGYPKREILQHGNSDASCEREIDDRASDAFALPGGECDFHRSCIAMSSGYTVVSPPRSATP